MAEADLKRQVQAYWNEHPCGTQFTDMDWGSLEFYRAVEDDRYRRQPFMTEAVGFARYPGRELLEIGCGLGTDLFQFARHGSRTTGLDLTPQSVALARRRFELEDTPGRFLVGDAERLPFPDHRFDVVYSFGVLHHTPRTDRAFREVRRILRPGGEAVIMLYHARSSHYYLGYPLALASRMRRGQGWIGREEYFRVYDGEENPLGKAYTRRQVRRFFEGFEILDQKSYDTWRPHLGRVTNQILLSMGKRFGFYLVTRARKPAAG
jgi:ubiquinone/menaquinone biosynthesis C-methylase UbiE